VNPENSKSNQPNNNNNQNRNINQINPSQKIHYNNSNRQKFTQDNRNYNNNRNFTSRNNNIPKHHKNYSNNRNNHNLNNPITTLTIIPITETIIPTIIKVAAITTQTIIDNLTHTIKLAPPITIINLSTIIASPSQNK
jgi:hypothetical protein